MLSFCLRVLSSVVTATVFIVFQTGTATAQDFWEPANGPYDGFGSYLNINSTFVAPNGSIFAGSDHDIYRSNDNGNSWLKVSKGLLGREIFCFGVSPQYQTDNELYAAGADGIFHSTDGGDNWVRFPSSLGYIRTIAIDASKRIFVGVDDGVFLSADNGATWTKSFPTDHTTRAAGALAMTRTGRVIHAGFRGSIWASSDSGSSWILVDSSGTGNFREIALTESDSGAERLYCIGGHSVLLSTDDGSHWSDVSTQNIDAPVTSLAANREGQLFIGTQGRGIARSTDHGVTWIYVNQGLTDSSYSALAVSPTTGYVFAGTAQRSVFRSAHTTLSTSSGLIEVNDKLLHDFHFKSLGNRTVFEFESGSARHVRLDIYDFLGRMLDVLYEGPLEAGSHEVYLENNLLTVGPALLVFRTDTQLESIQYLLRR